MEGTLPHYQIVLTREKGLDQMEVQVEVTPEVFSDKIGALEALQQKLERGSIESVLGHPRPASRWSSRTRSQRSEGKAKRVIDERKL